MAFRNNGSGVPGSLISSAIVLAAVTETGLSLQNQRVYQFDATFSPLSLLGSTLYWFSAINNSGQQPSFRWTQGLNAAAVAMFSTNSGATWRAVDSTRTPLNFTLYDTSNGGVVPEPASLIAWAVLGILGFTAYCRASHSRVG